MAFLKGEYDPANPPGEDGGDDLNFKPGDALAGDQLAQADVDDMAGMIDAIGGDIPAVERSSITLPTEDGAPPKPLSEMTLAE